MSFDDFTFLFEFFMQSNIYNSMKIKFIFLHLLFQKKSNYVNNNKHFIIQN